MQGEKVVTAQEMARVEGLACAQGASESVFMENAGKAIAARVAARALDKVVTLLVGKGNNGGDAYAAGAKLLEMGFTVEAIHPFPLESCSPLCQEQGERFKRAGGKPCAEISFPKKGVILDGLVGTGFHGKAEGVLAQAIESANRSGLPILAIDIPSGLNGDTGAVESVAICAAETIYLELPKIGFFIGKGWDHVGELVSADFGLDKSFIAQAKASAYLLDESVLPTLLPPIKRSRHKYERGYVLALAGSPGMPGSALLSSFAALRAGAGIVRLFYPEEMEIEFAQAPPELIREPLGDEKRLFIESKRASAWLIGPGLGRSKEVGKLLKKLLQKMDLPCVLDADALFFLGEHLHWPMPKKALLTPHRREMKHMLFGKEPTLDACQRFVSEKKCTLVLKGGPTFIFHPGIEPLVITRGDPGMATAGTGDVLAGILAALLAQKLDPYQAAVLGVSLHAHAGELAAKHLTSNCLVASDLITYLPEVYSELSS
jgi:hydroxyethylthiazole kinase-like uncharacterized protein yjeF